MLQLSSNLTHTIGPDPTRPMDGPDPYPTERAINQVTSAAGVRCTVLTLTASLLYLLYYCCCCCCCYFRFLFSSPTFFPRYYDLDRFPNFWELLEWDFFQAGCPSRHRNNKVKALKDIQQQQRRRRRRQRKQQQQRH